MQRREFYYWDSFWIVKGLLACGMNTTARHTLLNFVHFIDTFGLATLMPIYLLCSQRAQLCSEWRKGLLPHPQPAAAPQ